MQGRRDYGLPPLTEDNEANRLPPARSRYARLGVSAGAFAARVGVNRLTGGGRETDARALASALGSMKGPLMKVAQILTTIPDALPADYANELIRLQSQAPPMGAGFVRRRMARNSARSGATASRNSTSSPPRPLRSGRCISAVTLDGEHLACKLQYPEMASAVETDLSQLDLLFSLHRRMGAAIETREMAREIRERVREELDYFREAKIARLYGLMLADGRSCACRASISELSTRRLLTLQWLEGEKLTEFEAARRRRATRSRSALFDAWWRPFLRYGIIHGDPHLGNYAVVANGAGEANRRSGQSLRLRLRAHLPAAIRRRRRRALSRVAVQRREARRRTPTRLWGFSRPLARRRSRR